MMVIRTSTVRGLILGLMALLLSACSSLIAAPTPTPIYGIHDLTPPKSISTFTLTDQTNQPFSSSTLHGKWTLLAFGFTHCPDVCPDTLARFKQIKTALKTTADKVNFVFVGVDSKRDTPDVLKSYLANFDTSFIGLSGDEQALRAAATDFGVTFAAQQPDSEGNYAVDHTAASFLLNPDGQMVVFYSYGMDYDAMLTDVQTRVSG